MEEKIRIVFQETLFGPETIDPDIDFAHDFPEECRPNLPKEMQYFRKFGDTYLTIDMLLSFTHFNRQGKFVRLTLSFLVYTAGSGCSHHHRLPTYLHRGRLAAQTHPPDLTMVVLSGPPAAGVEQAWRSSRSRRRRARCRCGSASRRTTEGSTTSGRWCVSPWPLPLSSFHVLLHSVALTR